MTGVTCTNLIKTYGDLVAVDRLSFQVPRGECFGLLGPNGAGKTTTIEILEGLLEPDAGEVQILGLTWRANERELRQRIGVQLQETQLAEKLTVEETLRLFRSFYHRGRTVDDLLGLVELESKRQSYVGKLSGGQKQRLAVACALAGHPDLLFLDEPTTGLDPQSRRQLWQLLGEFRTQGGTILLTTHYMDEAERCDHVGYIYLSKLIVCGEPDDLKKLPDVNPPGTRRLDVTCDHVTTALHAMHQMPGVRTATVFGQSMHLLVDETVKRAQIEEQLRKVGVAHAEIHEMGPSLEDVFVQLSAKHAAERQRAA